MNEISTARRIIGDVLLALTSRKSKMKRLRSRQEIDELIKELEGKRKKD